MNHLLLITIVVIINYPLLRYALYVDFNLTKHWKAVKPETEEERMANNASYWLTRIFMFGCFLVLIFWLDWILFKKIV